MGKSVDEFISDVVAEMVDRIECPPSSEVWERIAKDLKKRERERRLRILKPLTAACILLIVLSGLFIHYKTPVTAFTEGIIRNISDIAGNVLKMNIKSDVKLPGDKAGAISDDPSIDEVQKKVPFEIMVPGYLPEGYSLINIQSKGDADNKDTVILLYGSGNKFIRIEERIYQPGMDVTVNIRDDNKTTVTEKTESGVKYTIVTYQNGASKLFWDVNNLSFKLDTSEDQAEAFKIVKAIK